MADLVGKVIAGRYEIVEKLGTGGFADVWKAKQLRPEGFVALKVLLPEHANDATVVEEFFGEAGLYVAFRDDPYIATILECDFDKENDLNYLVMTLLGDTAEDLIKDGPLPADRCFRLAADIAKALRTVHAKNLVHRDVKCSNIMTVPGEKRFVLTDFGVGLVQETVERTARTRDLNTSGTWSYASPEQIRARKKQDIGPPSDFYSLGVALYRAATGEYPFEPLIPQVMVDHMEKDPPDPRSVNPSVPESLAKLILRCMRKKPEDRFSSDDALVAAIDAAEEEWRTGGKAKKGGGAPWGLVAGGIAAVALIAAALWYFGIVGGGGGAGPVALASTPRGATFRLYEGPKERFSTPIHEGTTPVDFEGLAPGTYSLDLSKDGFFSLEGEQLHLSEGARAFRPVSLEQSFDLEVTSDPEGANVALAWIDQSRLSLPDATTPYLFQELHAGRYEVTLRKDGFDDVVDTVQVKEGTDRFHRALGSSVAITVWLFSDPAGASITIDGAPVSQPTNCEIRDLPAGAHVLSIVRGGYVTIDTTVVLDPMHGLDTLFFAMYREGGEPAVASLTPPERVNAGSTDPPAVEREQQREVVAEAAPPVVRDIPAAQDHSAEKRAAERARGQIADLKSAIDAQGQGVPEYRQALQHERNGASAMDAGNYPSAAEQYGAAKRIFDGLADDSRSRGDSKSAISKLANRYESALERGDLGALRTLIGNFGKSDEDMWSGFFKAAKKIDAETSLTNHKISGDTGSVDVKVWLEYEDNKGRKQNASFQYLWSLKRAGGDWAVASSKTP